MHRNISRTKVEVLPTRGSIRDLRDTHTVTLSVVIKGVAVLFCWRASAFIVYPRRGLSANNRWKVSLNYSPLSPSDNLASTVPFQERGVSGKVVWVFEEYILSRIWVRLCRETIDLRYISNYGEFRLRYTFFLLLRSNIYSNCCRTLPTFSDTFSHVIREGIQPVSRPRIIHKHIRDLASTLFGSVQLWSISLVDL